MDLQRGASPSGTASREATPVPAPGLAKTEVAQSPLRTAVKLEATVANGTAGAVAGQDTESGAEANSLKRKAEDSPEADKDIKKEKSV